MAIVRINPKWLDRYLEHRRTLTPSGRTTTNRTSLRKAVEMFQLRQRGESFRVIGKRYNVSREAARRHAERGRRAFEWIKAAQEERKP